jgi:hypothetical protein
MNYEVQKEGSDWVVMGFKDLTGGTWREADTVLIWNYWCGEPTPIVTTKDLLYALDGLIFYEDNDTIVEGDTFSVDGVVMFRYGIRGLEEVI